MNFKLLVVLLSFTFLFISCEDDETNKIAAAQNCLDESNSTTASACLTYVDGLTSKDSYIIRCAANFVSAGITPDKLADAIINRDSTTTTASPVLGMMGAFSFSLKTAADEAYNNCELSGVKSFILFASLARISTTMASVGNLLSVVGGGGTLTQAQMESALDDIRTNGLSTTDAEAIGESVSAMSSQYCGQDGADSKVCGKVNEAIANGGTNEAIGNALIDALNTD